MSIQRGQRVAHKELDENGGSAKQGVVRETLGEEPTLVVLESDGRKEAFDSRELVPLSGLPGPVVLRPRHALALLRTSQARLALLLDLVLVGLFISAALLWGWGVRELVLLGALIVVVALLSIAVLERDAAQESNGRPR